MSVTLCPCGSSLEFSQCCEPFHLGQKAAQTAEQLMRSRYSAFAVGNIDYIVQTTVPAQQKLLDVPAITAWSQQNQWLGLEVLKQVAKIGKCHAQVEFKARFKDKNNSAAAEQTHQELSAFVQHDQRWYFLDPTVETQLSLKSPCLCLSGQKFKHCCAPFLGMV
jgi:SEC-C motif-containing protein